MVDNSTGRYHLFDLQQPFRLFSSYLVQGFLTSTLTPIDSEPLQPDSLLGARNYDTRALGWKNKTFNLDYRVFHNHTEQLTNRLRPASDIGVGSVLTSLVFNLIVFVLLLTSYEVLRRLLPSVYASRRRREAEVRRIVPNLPEAEGSYIPLDWVAPVFEVPWSKVRASGGLDAYMFLRYIRMCLRITAVSAFWGLIVLWPVYASGGGEAEGWYHFSMANIKQRNWRIWVPTVFIYLLSAFVFYVIRQEYHHFIELRLDFLGRGEADVHPQHHYSLIIERVPYELRSDTALLDYFDNLFPGKVHSASMVLNLPDLEALSMRKQRVTRRLEKSIASFYATGKRPTHVVGRPRIMLCGIEGTPIHCSSLYCGNTYDVEDESNKEGPVRGERVDSIAYYTRDLAELNKQTYDLQRVKAGIAESGNKSFKATHWFSKIAEIASHTGTMLMHDSDHGSSPASKPSTGRWAHSDAAHSEHRQYGSFDAGDNFNCASQAEDVPPAVRRVIFPRCEPESTDLKATTHDVAVSWNMRASTNLEKKSPLISEDHLQGDGANPPPKRNSSLFSSNYSFDTSASYEGIGDIGRRKHHTFGRKLIGRLGVDFAIAGTKFLNQQLDKVVDSVVGTTMSSTGFVTFLDLASVTCAASAPLTHKPNTLCVNVAPEPRDITWSNCHIHISVSKHRATFANILLGLGAIVWSVPLAAIQAFASAEKVAQIPGMDWILTIDNGSLILFINSYLPVIALLGLIMLLPILFEWVAVSYEKRKTRSDVQASLVRRYFYYQLATIYITVTAGSLWKSFADILDHPAEVLSILGNTLPTVVGYFISLLITKILAGLPMIILRMGALGRMIFLRAVFRKDRLTQREVDEVYRKETLLFGWEYPTQLLVIVICFTYACISPIILIFGAMYFAGALMVYKKQVLYVYTPLYESGGALFPTVCDRTIVGLICGQLTFIGYSLIRKGFYQIFFLLPLLYFSFWMMNYFQVNFAEPSKRLTLERAMELDRVQDKRASSKNGGGVVAGAGLAMLENKFSVDYYRQPVLTEKPAEPLPYRRNQEDDLTTTATEKIRISKRAILMESQRNTYLSPVCSSSPIVHKRPGNGVPPTRTVV